MNKLLPLIGLATLITFISWHVAIGWSRIVELSPQALASQPLCNLPAGGAGPAPNHGRGLPIPYVNHYALVPCGWKEFISWDIFVLDVIIWLCALVLFVSLVRPKATYLRSDKPILH
jgi:hypothetical protein